MILSGFVFPRCAAPEGERKCGPEGVVDPRQPVVDALAQIWCDLLGIDQVGGNENFIELGGDSILGNPARCSGKEI